MCSKQHHHRSCVLDLQHLSCPFLSKSEAMCPPLRDKPSQHASVNNLQVVTSKFFVCVCTAAADEHLWACDAQVKAQGVAAQQAADEAHLLHHWQQRLHKQSSQAVVLQWATHGQRSSSTLHCGRSRQGKRLSSALNNLQASQSATGAFVVSKRANK